jgi:hypothetical protein
MLMRDCRVCAREARALIGVPYSCDVQRLYKTYTAVPIIPETESDLIVKPSPVGTE